MLKNISLCPNAVAFKNSLYGHWGVAFLIFFVAATKYKLAYYTFSKQCMGFWPGDNRFFGQHSPIPFSVCPSTK